MRRLVLPALACLLVAACMQPRKATPEAPFVPAEYEGYDRPGTASVAGQAFLKTASGDVKYGAGNPVVLTPVTSYSMDDFEVRRGRARRKPDPRAAQYERRILADGEGRFRFDGLPAGEYYVSCAIHWQYSDGRYLRTTGGTALARVGLEPGQQLENVIVTR